jgi:hypothetical protein
LRQRIVGGGAREVPLPGARNRHLRGDDRDRSQEGIRCRVSGRLAVRGEIPPWVAVTSLGEGLNYLFDPNNDGQRLVGLLRCVYSALAPGGVFVFDVAEPGQVARGTATRGFSEGEDWVVVLEKEEDAERRMLIRRITNFRRVGEHYRREDEIYRLRLYESSEIARELRRVGFRVRTMRAHGLYRLPRAHVAVVARKPA